MKSVKHLCSRTLAARVLFIAQSASFVACADVLGVGSLGSQVHSGGSAGRATTEQGGRLGSTASDNSGKTEQTTLGGRLTTAGSFSASAAPSAGGAAPDGVGGTASGGTKPTIVIAGASSGGRPDVGGDPIGEATSGGTSALGGATLGGATLGGATVEGAGSSSASGIGEVGGAQGNGGSGGGQEEGDGGFAGVASRAGSGGEGGFAGITSNTGGQTNQPTITTVYRPFDDLLATFDFSDGLSPQEGDTSGTCWRWMLSYRVPTDRTLPLQSLTPYEPMSRFSKCKDCNVTQAAIWQPLQWDEPAAGINYSFAAVGINPPRSVGMHPGRLGEYADLLWIAPRSGRVDVTATFQGLVAGATSTDVAVLVRGQVVKHVANVTTANAVTISFAGTVAAGDVIQFGVGVGANHAFEYDSTYVDIVVRLTSP